MITFTIEKDDKNCDIECTLEDTIYILKQKIIKSFDLQCKYVDIDFKLERPIRNLGKFNLEPGVLPRSLDNYTFDRYGLDGKNVRATFNEVYDYDEKKYSMKFKHKPFIKKNYGNNEISFNLDSNEDFPKLG